MRELSERTDLSDLIEICITYLEGAHQPDGRFLDRRSAPNGEWLPMLGSDDSNGRALFSLGCAVRAGGTYAERLRPLFDVTATAFESTAPRANAWAILGAAEVLKVHTGDPIATSLIHRCIPRLGTTRLNPVWPWPEDRLAYDNARLPQARIAAGRALGDVDLVEEGLALLTWLANVETNDDHFSFTPHSGWALDEPRPGFDQQPIEAGSMADACAEAFAATGDPRWNELTQRAAAWFFGQNDTGAMLFNPQTGGGRDGLEADGCNENEGAESTLAVITALQAARRTQTALRNAASTTSVSSTAAPIHRSAAP